MSDTPFDPRTILDVAATQESGLTLHFNDVAACRAFQVLLSATRRTAQRKLATNINRWDDLLNLTGWENISTKTLEGCKLWVGVRTKTDFGISRINGMNNRE